MNTKGSERHKKTIDKFAEATTPRVDNSDISERSVWWWIFVMPGRVILWFEYMFPESIRSVFGSARRRNIPLIQILYSIYFYVAAIGLIIYAVLLSNAAAGH